MSNNYFQFKQFRIAQEGCAMKVTTDACILGAWVPLAENIKRILDIGTGTGLLSLMLAQRNESVRIDAIEIDSEAALQAGANARDSKWRERIMVMQCDARDYKSADKYGLIVTNPPFFNSSLLSGIDQKDAARHTLSLSYSDLLTAIDCNLLLDGYAAVLLPLPESKVWEELCNTKGWYVFKRLNIRHREDAPIKRVVMLISRQSNMVLEEETLIIQENDGSYTKEFVQLQAPFYLKL